MGHVHFSIPKDVVKRLIERIEVPILVETGTYKGQTAFWAASFFKEVHTIELIEEISKSTQQDPNCPENVIFYIGDSSTVLPKVVGNISERTLFWLDGHWSPFIQQVDQQSPLMNELKAISSKPDSIIFIDDATAFYGPMPPPHKADQWPSLQEIFVELQALFPTNKFTIIEDVIISAPEDAMTAIESYWFDNFNARFMNEKSKEETPNPIEQRRGITNLFGVDKNLKTKKLLKKFFKN